MPNHRKSSSPKLLNRILRYITHTNGPWACVIKICSNGGVAYIIGEIIDKNNLNIANLMQTFENLLLNNCSTEFGDIVA